MASTTEHGESKVSIKGHLDVGKYAVNLDKALGDFESSTLNQNVNIVGIVGMSGCGKTFLAKELYNRKSLRFSSPSFLLDVNKDAERCGLHKLQKRMLQDVMGDADVSTLNNISKCKRAIAHHLKHHELFIVLDSIDDVEQLEALLPENNSVASGSMVILTTRDVGILKSYGISSIYTMKRLDPSPAKKLFCLHAFSEPSPIKGFECLIEKLSSACGGLPSSLEMLGGSLRGKSKDVWESLIDRIGLTNSSDKKQIIKILVANGDSLKGENSKLTKDLVWLLWRDCAYTSIPPSMSLENIRVLQVNGSINKIWTSKVKQPIRLRELVVLGSIGKFPRSIGLLDQLQKIVVDGCLNTSLEALPEEFCNLQSLEHLTLRLCRALTSLPANIGKLWNLRHLDLSFCSELKVLPPSFKQLSKLDYLDLESCSNLTIPPQFLGKMTSLQYLNFKDCKRLKVLPSQVPYQKSLKSLNLRGTSLEEVPNEIGRLGNLEVLELGSPFLTSLPVSLGNLKNLQKLILNECTSLTGVTDILGEMANSKVQVKNNTRQLTISEIEIP